MNADHASEMSASDSGTQVDPLFIFYDELDTLWKQAEEDLAAMRVWVDVVVEVNAYHGGVDRDEPDWEKREYLAWRKIHERWRICLGISEENLENGNESWEWKPVVECPTEKRVELARRFGLLKAKMKEARLGLLPQVASAVAAMRTALAK